MCSYKTVKNWACWKTEYGVNVCSEFVHAGKELVEFRLGYTTNRYTDFCMKCRDFTEESYEKNDTCRTISGY